MRSSRATNATPGWFPVEPDAATASASTEPPSRVRVADPLGLSRPANPLRFLARKPPASRSTRHGGNQSRALGTPPDHTHGGSRRASTQLHRKLVHYGGADDGNPTEAFSPLRSLRLASIPARPTTTGVKEDKDQHCLLPAVKQTDRELTPRIDSHPRGRLRRLDQREPTPLPPPLHELIQTVSDGVLDRDDPLLQLNRASVVQLFMEQWQRQFDANAASFKSIAVRYEVGYRELRQMAVNLPTPNELLTAFSCRTLDDLTPHFGPFAHIMRVASAEVRRSIYLKLDDGQVPYFALVQYQRQQLAVLERDREGKKRRNKLLAHEIDHVLATFHHFLDECGHGLLRSIIREWHSVAVVHKKNSKKYIEYFSAWFSSSTKTLVPRIFTIWKRQAAQRKLHVAKTQLRIDALELSELQRQVDEATAQRDVAQLELHAVRNDRKQLEDLVQRLTRKIQSANAFLESSQRREPLIANEGHVRMEAASFLPPLVLESLLRGYHDLGFLQHQCERGDGSTISNSDAARQARPIQAAGQFIRQAFAQIIELQAQSASCDGVGAKESDPPVPQLSTSVNADIADAFCLGVHSIQDQLRAPTSVAKVLFTEESSSTSEAKPTTSGDDDTLARVCSEFVQLLSTMRVQDEHYVRHPKLFSARLLESHEVSVVPATSPATASTISLSQVGQVGLPIPPATGGSDLGVINGSRRFSTASFPVPTRASGSKAISTSAKYGRTSSTASLSSPSKSAQAPPVPGNIVDVSDFAMARASLGNLVALLLARLATEYGALLFSPSDMTIFAHSPYALTESEAVESSLVAPKASSGPESPRFASNSKVPTLPISSVASASHFRKFRDLLGAYDTWNRLAAQLIHTGIVQSQGVVDTGAVGDKTEGGGSTLDATSAASGSTNPGSLDTTSAALRPKLLHQLELLPHSALLATGTSHHRSGGSPGSRPSNSGGAGCDRLEQAAAAASRVRTMGASTDTAVMLDRVSALHDTVHTAAEQQRDFRLARQQLRDLHQLQWSQACQLAAPTSTSSLPPSRASGSSAASTTSNGVSDPRPHLFECVSFDNTIMARLLSVEREPVQELQRVRTTMEKKQTAFRQLYTRHRAASGYALSLDELWHVVKLLRLPREVHALAPPTASQLSQRQSQHVGDDEDDDELFFSTNQHISAHGQYHEQLFSPEDLAEVLLLLCNEQFPSLPSLSARVEHFAASHLPFAVHNATNSGIARSRFFPGGIRDLLLQPDAKRALSDHTQTLRIIFRRYCAKERNIPAATTAPSVLTTTASVVFTVGAIPGRPPVLLRGGRAKFMRLNDWLAFVQDYHLLRARFTLERAIGVFRGVLGQDLAAPRQSDDRDEAADRGLEMAYGAFCEAVAAMALCFTPDPFARPAAKISQFVSRFLPVAPEEAHDLALQPISMTKNVAS